VRSYSEQSGQARRPIGTGTDDGCRQNSGN